MAQEKEDWGPFIVFVIIALLLYGAGKYLDAREGQFNSFGELVLFLFILYIAYKLSKKK